MSELSIQFAAMSITWNNPVGDDFIPWLKEVKEAGYDGISCFANHLKVFIDTPDYLKQLLVRFQLSLASVSVELQFDLGKYEPILQFMQILRCENLVCIDPAGTKKEYTRYANLLNSIGEMALKYGIQVYYHNHTDSVGETYNDMEKLISGLDIQKVSLMLDTGHATKDFIEFPYEERAVRFLKKYWHRITFMEWKDWNEVTQLNTPIGEGLTDYESIFALMQERGYKGWITVEQNGNEGLSLGRSPFDCARISRDYIRNGLNL